MRFIVIWKNILIFLTKLRNTSFLKLSKPLAPREFCQGEVRSTKEGGSRVGGSGGGAPGRRRRFQKICKKSMKNLEFFKNFQENLAIL